MKISEINLTGQEIHVQTKTDAWAIIWSEYQLQMYMQEFGDVEIVEKPDDKGWFEVPAFKDEIASYVEMKIADCAKWGCE
jgi:hypothetical protein